MENWLWKRCWPCRETDSRMNGECECDVTDEGKHRVGALHCYVKSDRSVAGRVWKRDGPG